MKMIPGLGKYKKQLDEVQMPEKEIKKVEAIINSMTAQERRQPKILNASRRRRIATGSGSSVQEVNQLMRNFDQMSKMLKKMMSGKGKPGEMPQMPGMPGMPGAQGMPGLPSNPGRKGSTKKRKKKRKKKKK